MRRLVRTLVRAFMRGLHRLSGSVLELLEERQPAVANSDDGPPEHWRKMVEQRAPQLLREAGREEAGGWKQPCAMRDEPVRARSQLPAAMEQPEASGRKSRTGSEPVVISTPHRTASHAQPAMETKKNVRLEPAAQSKPLTMSFSQRDAEPTRKPNTVFFEENPAPTVMTAIDPEIVAPQAPRQVAGEARVARPKPVFITTDLPPQRQARKITLSDNAPLFQARSLVEDTRSPEPIAPQRAELPVAKPVRRGADQDDNHFIFLSSDQETARETIAALATPVDFDDNRWPELPDTGDDADDEELCEMLSERQRIDFLRTERRGQPWNV
jgi:hypothetical protein